MKKIKNKYIYTTIILISLTMCFIWYEFKRPNENINTVQSAPKPKQEESVNLNIMTTNKMLYYMIKDIVKDKNNVNFMFETEEQQWSYIYLKNDLTNISGKDLFLYSGAGFEPWISKFINELSKNKVSVVNVSRGIKIIEYVQQVKYQDTVVKENPYYWMNLDNYKTAMFNITSAIQDKDPQNRKFYEDNFKQVLVKLDNYAKQFQDISEKFKDSTFIVSNDKFDYFLRYNNFKYIKIYDDYDENAKEKTEEKIEEILKEKKTDDLIFIYDDDEELKKNEELIKKYDMGAVKIIIYDSNLNYIDIIENNINSLNNYLLTNIE